MRASAIAYRFFAGNCSSIRIIAQQKFEDMARQSGSLYETNILTSVPASSHKVFFSVTSQLAVKIHLSI